MSACLLEVHLHLVPWLLAMAELLLCLPLAVVPLGLAAVQGPQASRDPPAMGGVVPVTVAAVAVAVARRAAVVLWLVLLVLRAHLVLVLVMAMP